MYSAVKALSLPAPPPPASSLFISFKGERPRELSSKNGLALSRGIQEGEGDHLQEAGAGCRAGGLEDA